MDWNEDYVKEMTNEALDIFAKNMTGPKKYKKVYDKYKILLNGNANRERDQFLKSQTSLKDFEDKMQEYMNLKKDIMAIRNSALLNLFMLDCTKLNKEMIEQCLKLYKSLIQFQVTTNRTWNRSICNQV